MTKAVPTIREWWIQPYNIGAHAFTYKTADNDVHVIEFAAYQALQKELANQTRASQRHCKNWMTALAERDSLQTELSQLRERNSRLSKALTRFAKIESADGDDFDGVHEDVILRVEVTAGDIQDARDALAEAGGG